MKAATLLIIAFSHAAHWLSGAGSTVQVGWSAQAPVVPAVVQWELRFDGAVVSSGKAPLPDAKQPIEIHIVSPTVRVRTTLFWNYHLLPAAGGADIEAGSIPIQVYPTDLIGDYSKVYAGKNVVIVDKDRALSRVLTSANVPFVLVDDVSQLETLKPDIVLVAEDMVGAGLFAQGPLQALARSGGQVMVFRQARPTSLLGYPLRERNITKNFSWELDHALLVGLDADDAASWLQGETKSLALQVPVDAAAIELGYWPAEAGANVSAPIDTLLLTRRLGTGRLVLCQIPLGNVTDDPRSRILLNNVLNYLSTRPEPTPRPSERQAKAAVPVVQLPSIRIPSGGHP